MASANRDEALRRYRRKLLEHKELSARLKQSTPLAHRAALLDAVPSSTRAALP
jgi:hypothetical protein